MKNHRIMQQTAFMILFLTIQFKIMAQNQSMLLPIPGNNNSTLINFVNPENPVISCLPSHLFYHDNLPTPIDPHNEQQLEYDDVKNAMNTMYLGQHPMYAQTVVHDKEGNLLFFIVDNNIYNQDGEA